VDHSDLLDVHYLRLHFVDVAKETWKNLIANKPVKETIFATSLNMKLDQDNEYAKDLIRDIQGEVSMSIKQDTFRKWGKHYILSLLMAHQFEYCNNFKDPGVQHYGGKLFEKIRDVLDDSFVKMEPPVPTRKSYTPLSVSATSNVSTHVTMNDFYDNSGGCFDGNCLVTMADNSTKFVKDVKKGDYVKTNDSSRKAKVVCVVKTIVNSNVSLVEFQNGLLITPYHPVRINNEWKFPIDVHRPNIRYCHSYFTFVLSNSHVVLVNDIECITLAHGFKFNSVVEHAYYGTNKVIEDLKKNDGFSRGLVVFDRKEKDL